MSSRTIRGPIKYDNYKVVLSGDYTVVNEAVVIVNKTSGAATQITLPASVAANARREVIVLDGKGDAATNNITVVPAGSDTINGGSSYVIGENYGKARFLDAGSGNWLLSSTPEVSLTEIGYLNGVTPGTSAASKALVADSSKNLAFTGRLTTSDGVTSGTARVVGGLAYSNTAASTAVASTSAETVFDTNYAIPANTLKAGTVVRVRFQGIQTALVGTDTLAFKLYIGGSAGTALLTSAATTGVSNGTIQGECTLICRTAGTTGTFVSTGTYKVVSAEGTMTVKDDIQASTTINTQAQQLVTATATFNTTNANSVRMDLFTVEIS
jgi:hypothetical protein